LTASRRRNGQPPRELVSVLVERASVVARGSSIFIFEPRQAGPEEFRRVDRWPSVDRNPEQLGPTAREHVVTALRALRQSEGERLHHLQRDETDAKLIRLRRGLLLARRVCRQQQARAELQQPGRHHHPVGFLALWHRCRRLPQRRGQPSAFGGRAADHDAGERVRYRTRPAP
jgi:hypothetical protein